MRLTKGIIVATVAALITSTSSIALASSVDPYSQEVIQMQSTITVLQLEQKKLEVEIKTAQNDGDLTLAAQKQAQYEQNNVMLNQLSALSANADIERMKKEIADLEAERLQLGQQHYELMDRYTEVAEDAELQSSLKLEMSKINMKIMNIGMRIVSLQVQIQKKEKEIEREKEKPSIVGRV